MARIGLWGGSFNPPTLAHKAMAEHAIKALNLDALWWVVCPQNVDKDPKTLAPFQHRLAMVQSVIADNPKMVASDIENRLGSSVTLNTLRHICADQADDTLIFLMGTDNWNSLHLWGDDFAELFEYASIAVFQRPGYDDLKHAKASKIFADRKAEQASQLAKSGSWIVLNNPQMEMSATGIRRQIAANEIMENTDPHIADYIERHKLYR